MTERSQTLFRCFGLRGSDKLWIYLSWDETCVHTSRASANTFNAPSPSASRKEITEIAKEFWGKAKHEERNVDGWNLKPQPRPSLRDQSGFVLRGDYGMHMDPISLFSGDSQLQVTPLPAKTACRDPPWPRWLPTPNCVNKTSRERLMAEPSLQHAWALHAALPNTL